MRYPASDTNSATTQVFTPVMPETGIDFYATGKRPEDFGVINQYGLNRKVSSL